MFACLYLYVQCEIKTIIRQRQLEMALATDAEPQSVASGCTSDHSVKMTPKQQAEFESRLRVQYSTPYDTSTCKE